MKDTLTHWLARHLPRRLVYWTVVHAFARASCTTYSTECCTGLKGIDILKHWEA